MQQIEIISAPGYRDGKPATINYKVLNGTYYRENTPDAVVEALEVARKYGDRVSFRYGDTATGRDWLDLYDVSGTVSRSCGSVKIPLLIKTARSTGGGSILTDCIVKLVVNGRIAYQAPTYRAPVIDIQHSTADGYSHAIYANNTLIANVKSERAAAQIARRILIGC
jgi:hypothetical protein